MLKLQFDRLSYGLHRNRKTYEAEYLFSKLQDRLLLDGIAHPWNLPSRSTISKCVRNDLFMTKKRIQQIPAESQRNDNIELRNDFLEHLRTVHCFD